MPQANDQLVLTLSGPLRVKHLPESGFISNPRAYIPKATRLSSNGRCPPPGIDMVED